MTMHVRRDLDSEGRRGSARRSRTADEDLKNVGLRVTESFHGKLSMAAMYRKMSLSSYVVTYLEDQVSRDFEEFYKSQLPEEAPDAEGRADEDGSGDGQHEQDDTDTLVQGTRSPPRAASIDASEILGQEDHPEG